MSRLALFLLYLALGVALRLLFAGQSALGKKLRVKTVAVVFDVLFSAAAVSSIALLAFFFNDGIVAVYNLAAVVIGYLAALAIL